MNIFRDMPNSQIEQAIERIYKTEKNRAILHDRVIDGMTYEELMFKHHPESDWWGRQDRDRFKIKVQKMVGRLEVMVSADKESGE